MAEGAGAAANLIPADVDAVLTLCGFTNDNDRRKFWLVEGWSETVVFGMFSYKEIEAMASRAERRPMAQRVIVGAVKLKKLKVISYWVRKLSNQGNDDPDINTLDNVTLHNFGMFSYKEIEAMASRAERRPMAQRVIVGAVKLKKLKVISYWVRKLSNQGNDDPDINTLDNVTLHNLPHQPYIGIQVQARCKRRSS